MCQDITCSFCDEIISNLINDGYVLMGVPIRSLDKIMYRLEEQERELPCVDLCSEEREESRESDFFSLYCFIESPILILTRVIRASLLCCKKICNSKKFYLYTSLASSLGCLLTAFDFHDEVFNSCKKSLLECVFSGAIDSARKNSLESFLTKEKVLLGEVLLSGLLLCMAYRKHKEEERLSVTKKLEPLIFFIKETESKKLSFL